MAISKPNNSPDQDSVTPRSFQDQSQKQTKKHVIYSRMAILSKVQQEYPLGNSAVEDRITVSLVNKLYELQRVPKTDISPYLPGGQYNLFA